MPIGKSADLHTDDFNVLQSINNTKEAESFIRRAKSIDSLIYRLKFQIDFYCSISKKKFTTF